MSTSTIFIFMLLIIPSISFTMDHECKASHSSSMGNCGVTICTSGGICSSCDCYESNHDSYDGYNNSGNSNDGSDEDEFIVSNNKPIGFSQCIFTMPDGSICSESEILNAKIIMGLAKDYTFESGPSALAIVGTFKIVINFLRNTNLDPHIRFECAKEYVHRKCFLPNTSHHCYKDSSSGNPPTYVYSTQDLEKINKANQDPILRALLGRSK